ncbi:MAG: polyprenyl synthetase family protein [Rhodobacteraceae bacterium]|nr:polyprenyl synthetase family protein [Paracoccaceae bacterium]
MTLALALAEAAELVQAGFDDLLEARAGVPVRDAMLYAVRGGKRLRGFLVLESARLHGVGPERAIHAALAVEALHAYSLVHDDLPCMDDDDLRRGQPTVHKVWDEATAVLAGDALQTFAFECLTHTDLGSPEIRIDLVASLSRASGIDGMVLGQAQDMAAESAGLTPNVASVTELQANKTGALIRWSAEAGPRLAAADPSALSAYASALGLAFQIADDILDVEGDPETAGKRLRKDAGAGKATFVGLLGLDGAKTRAADLVEEACAALAPYGADGEILREAAHFAISRQS